MLKNFLFFVMGAIACLFLFVGLAEDSYAVRNEVLVNHPYARVLSQVHVSGGTIAIFLCENQELTVVIRDRFFHAGVVHKNDSFSCK